jgi:hypothetical protein
MKRPVAAACILLLLSLAALQSARAQDTVGDEPEEEEEEALLQKGSSKAAPAIDVVAGAADRSSDAVRQSKVPDKAAAQKSSADPVDGDYDLITKMREKEEAAEGAQPGVGDADEEEELLETAAAASGTGTGAAKAAPKLASGTDANQAKSSAAAVGRDTAATPQRSAAGSAGGGSAASSAGGSKSSAGGSSGDGGGGAGSKGAGAKAGSKSAAAAKDGTPAPVQKFKIYNEQWLEQAEGIAEDFVDTPAMKRLKTGTFGAVDLKALDIDGAGSIATGVHAVLSRCLHTLNLFKAINMFHDGVLPKREVLPDCTHRKFRLLFVLEKGSDYWKHREVMSELASVNIRLFPFAAALAKRGHTTFVSDPEHFHQVDMDKLDAIIFVKVLEQGFQILQNSSVPLIWDHVDEWDGFPFWNIEMWDKKEVFAGVLTAGRVAKVAFDKAGVPAQVLYHNHANFANLHRADRTPPVKVLALQGDYHSHDSDIFPMLEDYCKKNKLKFRSGHYTGKGWEVQEYAQLLKQGVANYGGQIGWYMGFKSVDVAVLWPKGYTQFHVCYKPTSRLAYFASLGIPLVTYPFASYIDILVEFGYPLVAETLEEVAVMLDKLLASPQLRQEASEKLLEIAKFLSVDELAEQYEQALCQFLSPEALELRKGMTEGEGEEQQLDRVN